MIGRHQGDTMLLVERMVTVDQTCQNKAYIMRGLDLPFPIRSIPLFFTTTNFDMATTTANKQEVVEKWHHHYDDPRDDAVLITSDNVKFRVSSRLLFKTLFAHSNGPNIDAKPSIGSHDPFLVDIPAIILEFFLGMLPPTTRLLLIAGLTFQQCQDLLTFTEHYKCEHLIPLVRTQLISKAVGPGEPTALLLLASSRNDWALGRSALRKMDEKEILRTTAPLHEYFNYYGADKDAEKIMRAFLAKLRPDWQQTLTELLFFSYFENSSAIKNWSLCVGKFEQPDKGLKRTRS
jgi:hypothetical protein